MAGVGITDAIVIAMREAIERRTLLESPLQTARLPENHGVVVSDEARKPLPREAFDDMWDNDVRRRMRDHRAAVLPSPFSRPCSTSHGRNLSIPAVEGLVMEFLDGRGSRSSECIATASNALIRLRRNG